MFDKEQIIKAWECCGSTTYRCDECPIDQQKKDDCICGGYLAQCTLALYRELTKENERFKQLNKDLFEDVARLSVDSLTIEADTVRRMQERLKEAFERHPSSCGDCIKRTVDQIAKEILEETK